MRSISHSYCINKYLFAVFVYLIFFIFFTFCDIRKCNTLDPSDGHLDKVWPESKWSNSTTDLEGVTGIYTCDRKRHDLIGAMKELYCTTSCVDMGHWPAIGMLKIQLRDVPWCSTDNWRMLEQLNQYFIDQYMYSGNEYKRGSKKLNAFSTVLHYDHNVISL